MSSKDKEAKFRARFEKEQKLKEERFAQRYKAESDATSTDTPKGESPSMGQMVFPETTQMFKDKGYKGAMDAIPSMMVKGDMELISKPLFDALGLSVRTPAALLGQGSMTEPSANVWASPRKRFNAWIESGMKSEEEMKSDAMKKYANGHWTDQLPDTDPDKYLLDPRRHVSNNTDLKILQQAGNTMFEMGGDGFVIGGILKAVLKKIGKTALKGVPKSDLTQGGFKMSPAQTMEDGPIKQKLEAKELKAQANPYTSDIPRKLEEHNLDLLQKKVSGSSEGLGGKDIPGVRHGESRGQAIGKTGMEVQEKGHKLYQKGEDVITRPISESRIPGTIKETKIMEPTGLLDEAGEPLMKETIKEEFVNNASLKLNKMLDDAGYKGGKIKQTAKIGDETIKATLKFRDQIAEAQTMGELINVKRNIADDIFKGNKEGIFTGDKNQKFLRKINKSLNESIEETILSQFPKKDRDSFVKAYRSMNKQLSNNIKLMAEPGKTLKLGKSNFNAGKVMDDIQSIPPDRLEDLKKASKTDQTIKPFYEELQRGAFESLIMKSSPKDGFSPEKFRTAWTNIKPETKNALFPKSMVKDVDTYLSQYAKTTEGNIKKANPSGTAILDAKLDDGITIITAGKNKLKALLTYSAIKHYYKNGKGFWQSTVNLGSYLARKGDKTLSKAQIDKIAKASAFKDLIVPSLREED